MSSASVNWLRTLFEMNLVMNSSLLCFHFFSFQHRLVKILPLPAPFYVLVFDKHFSTTSLKSFRLVKWAICFWLSGTSFIKWNPSKNLVYLTKRVLSLCFQLISSYCFPHGEMFFPFGFAYCYL